MEKDLNLICQKLRAWVLWEASNRTAKSILRRGKIPIRSGERFMVEFRNERN